MPARALTSGKFDHTSVEWTLGGKEILFSSVREDDAEYRWRESEIYAVNVATRHVRQLTRRKGPDSNPTVSPDGKLVAYTGYDWTKDTWIDSKLYVMNIDGSNPRLVSGDWDRSPQGMEWNPDGSGLYFTSQNEGSQNLYFLPVGAGAGSVRQVTKGVHMLTVSDVGSKGKAVGTLTSFLKPPDVVSVDLKNPVDIKQLTSVNDDILPGRSSGRSKRSGTRRPTVSRFRGGTSRRRISIRRRSTRSNSTSTAVPTACTAWGSTSAGRKWRRTATSSSTRTLGEVPAMVASSAT